VPVTPAPATTDSTPAPQSLTFGGLNVSPQDLKVRFGDFSGAVTPTTLNPDQGSNELRFTYNNPDPNSVFRRADVFRISPRTL
jgi:hypothetical protein